VRLSRKVAALSGALNAVETTMGLRPPSCPWWAFHDPEVGEVLRAHDWDESGQLREWWGEDPPWRLVEGVGHYRRAQSVARADATRLRRQHRKPPTPPRGGGRTVTRSMTRG